MIFTNDIGTQNFCCSDFKLNKQNRPFCNLIINMMAIILILFQYTKRDQYKKKMFRLSSLIDYPRSISLKSNEIFHFIYNLIINVDNEIKRS